MKSIKELFSRFGNLQELPVSEEILGAYAEGNLTPFEIDEVDRLSENEPMVSSVMTEIQSDTIVNFDDLNTDNAILNSVGMEANDYSHSLSSIMIMMEDGVIPHCAGSDITISNLLESDKWDSEAFDNNINGEIFSSDGDSLDSHTDSIDTYYPLLGDGITDFDI